jgi:hypothetical protein
VFEANGRIKYALISCIDGVTTMLETNSIVRYLLVNFFKAFNTVDLAVVLRKVKVLTILSSIKSWIINSLTNRAHITKLFDRCSLILEINRSIVQGSEVGSYLYTLMEGDLHTLCKSKVMFKFAHNTNLLVPENSEVSVKDEFSMCKKGLFIIK